MNTVKIRPTIEKECEICGKPFTTTSSNRKYCDDCRTDSRAKKEILRKHLISSIARYGTGRQAKPVRKYEYHNTCKNCGKSFVSYNYSRAYCSEECKIEHHRKNTFCAYCGKAESETDDFTIGYTSTLWFCCKEHQDLYAETAKEAKTCPICGKKFVGKTKYCSFECSVVGRKKIMGERTHRAIKVSECRYCHQPYDAKMAAKSAFNISDGFCSIECKRHFYEERHIGHMEKCDVCGTMFYRTDSESDYNVCSEKCLIIIRNNIQEMKRRSHENSLQNRKKKNTEGVKISSIRKKKKFTITDEWVQKNGLCGICKIKYCNCPRMQSDFTEIPDGAECNDGKIVKCPLYVA